MQKNRARALLRGRFVFRRKGVSEWEEIGGNGAIVRIRNK